MNQSPKIIIAILISTAFVISCHHPSNEEIAQSRIKEMLAHTMVNPNSYESISFVPLDSLFTRIEDDSIYNTNKKMLLELETKKSKTEQNLRLIKKSKESMDQLNSFAIVNTPYLDQQLKNINNQLIRYNFQIDSIRYKIDSLIKNFKPSFIGYTIEHRFKYLSRGGFLMENTTLFYLNPSVSMVTKFKDDLGIILEYNPNTNKYEPK